MEVPVVENVAGQRMLRLTEAQASRLRTFPLWTVIRENAKIVSALLAAVILTIPLGVAQYRLAAANGHIDRGLELHYKGRNEEAIQQFQQSLKTRPGYFGAYNDIGLCLESEGRHTQAIALYHQALAFAPNNSQVLSNLGIALFRQGDRATGLAELWAAVKSNPDDARAYTMLGNALDKSGDRAQARQEWQTGLHLGDQTAAQHLRSSGGL